MSGSRIVPAATATVKVQRDKDNGNTKIDLKVSHLARPSSLTPPASVYIMWVHARGSDAVKQGAIGVDKDLKGELKSVTVLKEFDLLVTAEQSDSATAPSGVEIFSTRVDVS
ncbi:MAG: hypothetical protein M3Y50_12925 [Acidobacteriota bacterium]|nr:hypothetical protein [Acidobacteriota bacterium]